MKLRGIITMFVLSIISLSSNVMAGAIPVANYSFESPVVQPVYPYASPVVDDWVELDMDPLGSSQNTGVFLNVTDINDVDGAQVAFLGGEKGNAFLQDLSSTYQVDKSYKMTVGVCVSAVYPPFDPNGLQIAFYYQTATDPNRIDIVSGVTPPPSSFSSEVLEDHSIYLPAVQADDPWADRTIGIAIRATGPMGGYWDLDNVRVTEYPLVPNFDDASVVNFVDFAIMAQDWLYCDEPMTDVTGEGCVDEDDLLILMEYWLDNV